MGTISKHEPLLEKKICLNGGKEQLKSLHAMFQKRALQLFKLK
jgi:hypothetical protein